MQLNRSKKVLVTGGAGFIGSHLVERLVQDGHEVVVLDNLATGRETNLSGVGHNSRVRLHRVDVAENAKVEPLFGSVDWVFHLAALADIVPSIQRPLDYHRTNVDGTVSVLEAARKAGVARFVYAASSSCYGIPDFCPTPESAEPKPAYPYALTKHIGEQYVMHWAQVYRMGCVSLRMFNVFGPRVRSSGTYGAVFGVFLAQKLAGQPFTVVGDGTQTRDFTFVTDVVDAFVRAAESGVTGEVFNIGSGATYSVNHLASLLGGKSIHIPKRPGEPDCTFADTQKIARVLGWKPSISFEEGIRLMIQDLAAWKDAPVWSQRSIAEATADWFRYLG
jgi:UDP-glucose 4-epimerase